MSRELTPERADELLSEWNEAREELEEVIRLLAEIVRECGGMIEARANAYWLSQLRQAIDSRQAGIPMESGQRELEAIANGEDEDA